HEAAELGGVELDEPGERRGRRERPPGQRPEAEVAVHDGGADAGGPDVEGEDRRHRRAPGSKPRLRSFWPSSPPTRPAPSTTLRLSISANHRTSWPRSRRMVANTAWATTYVPTAVTMPWLSGVPVRCTHAAHPAPSTNPSTAPRLSQTGSEPGSSLRSAA